MAQSDFNLEVRTLFAEDANAFLARLENATAVLLEAQALAPAALGALGAARSFQEIEDAGQSIRGSAASVDADFLADAAAAVEELAKRGESALRLAMAHAQRAHAIASFCSDATREMRAMLNLYVEDAGEEATWLGMALREKAEDVKTTDEAALERLSGASSPVDISDDYAAAAATNTERPALAEGGAKTEPESAEESFGFEANLEAKPLSRVFQEEAREVMLALRGHVESLVRTGSLVGLDAVDTLLTTLSGSAASAELPYFSGQAAEALARLDEVRRAPNQSTFERLAGTVDKLLSTVAIAPINRSVSMPPPSADVPDVFIGEATRVVEAATAIADALVSRVGATDQQAAEVAKLFHRLTGTALVVDALDVAEESQAIVVACRSLTDGLTLGIAIREACDRIIAKLPSAASGGARGFESAPPAVARSVRPPASASIRPSEHPNFVSDGLLAIFREEVQGLLPQIVDNMARIDLSPRDAGALEELHRVFHTLKGSAAAVGQDGMSAQAAAIEDKLEALIEEPTRIEPRFAEKLRADAIALLDQVGLGHALSADAIEELSSDELVEVPSSRSPGESARVPSELVAASAEAIEAFTGEWSDFVAQCSGAIERAVVQASSDSDDELAAFFVEEVEQIGAAMAEPLDRLSKDPSDREAVRTLERLFHTLKGAAATVERTDLSAAAEFIRGALEAVDGGAELTPERVAMVRSAADRILEVASRAPASSRGGLGSSVEESVFAFDEVREVEARPDEELLKIFQQEARESLVALHGHVETLLASPTSVYAAEFIERLFHTLKGAAATVGLADISSRAAELQERMADAIATKRVPDAQFVEELVRKTNELLAGIGVAPLVFRQPSDSVVSGASGDNSGDDLERNIFAREVKAICRLALDKARELSSTSDAEENARLRQELAELFHRLKGTAATMGSDGVAQEATRAMEAARGRASTNDLVDVVRRSIARIAELAGFQRSSAHRGAANKVERENVSVPTEPELWESFEQECTEILDSLEKAVLVLEEVAQPKEVLDEIFRHVHTLKGAVNTVGLSPTGKVLHTAEDFLEELGKAAILPPMRTVAGILVDVVKSVRQNLRTASKGWVETPLAGVAARIEAAMRPGGQAARGQGDKLGSAVGDTFASGFDSAALFASVGLRSKGQSADASNGSAQARASADDEKSTPEERAYIRVATSRLDALMNLAGELVVSRSRLSSRVNTLRVLYGELARSRARLSSTVDTFREQYEFAGIGGKEIKKDARMPAVFAVAANDNVQSSASRETFGELELDEYDDIHVLSRSLAEIGNDFEEAFRTLSGELSTFADDADSLGGIISGIQGEVTRARMVPLDAVFTRLRFPIRDAAVRDSKEVQVVTEGGEVNIDKTIADAILQPMLHLVRNAVVHGIESQSKRQASGKTPTGTIRLSARQQAGLIVIEVADDGAGLDLARLRARGIELGLIDADVSADDVRVRELVFAAGLSTKESADDVAGRGVGGDVVKRTIERLNGGIRVETTKGRGTSFLITLPLSLAITRALLVREGGSTYAVPLYFAERIIDADTLTVARTGGERRVLVDGVFTRSRHLEEYFEAAVPASRGGPALVLRVGDDRVVVQVDQVLGQEEIVVKKAGELVDGHPLFAGVTLRGTGELVLILDVPGLLEEHGGHRQVTDDVAGPTRALTDSSSALAVASGGDSVTDSSATGSGSGSARAESPAVRAKVDPKPDPVAERAPAPAPAKPKAKPEATKPVDGKLTGLRALVVDDSISVRKVAEGHLKAMGLEVVVAVDGVDGLAKLREGHFDIVFSDLEMPRMHGYDFIRQLRLLAAYQKLPVVVVSSRSGQKHQDHARGVGATDYITKPFSQQSLEAVIRRWVRR